MNEIAERLRNWRLVHLTQLRYLMETASDEIERLQALADKRGELAVDRRREIERLRGLLSRTGSVAAKTGDDAAECRSKIEKTPERERLTVAEREAVMLAATCSEHGILPSTVAAGDRLAATLRGLLERLQ